MIEKCYTDVSFAKKILPSTLEGCVVRISDIIAYLGKDRQDAVKAKLVDEAAYSYTSIGMINAEIINNLHHSVTEVNARGMYSHTDLQMLVCIINKHQLADLERILTKYPDTFSFVSRVNQTIGNFKRIKGK